LLIFEGEAKGELALALALVLVLDPGVLDNEEYEREIAEEEEGELTLIFLVEEELKVGVFITGEGVFERLGLPVLL